MMRLEDLVPPLELCKQIPQGEFEDSAMVWAANPKGDNVPFVELRYIIEGVGGQVGVLAPAPTLAEIFAERRFGLAMLNCSWSDMFDWWECSGCTLTIPQTMIAKHDPDNPATAALRLYLEVAK